MVSPKPLQNFPKPLQNLSKSFSKTSFSKNCVARFTQALPTLRRYASMHFTAEGQEHCQVLFLSASGLRNKPSTDATLRKLYLNHTNSVLHKEIQCPFHIEWDMIMWGEFSFRFSEPDGIPFVLKKSKGKLITNRKYSFLSVMSLGIMEDQFRDT